MSDAVLTSDAETHSEPSPDLTGRILVVDDSAMNRKMLEVTLKGQGHSVDLADGGVVALARLQSGGIDIVLLDMLMPEMDGFEVLDRMKQSPELRDLPVIVVSALDDVNAVARCIQTGADDYLPKPLNPILLKARIQSSLQRKRLRDMERTYLQQELVMRQQEKLATLGKLSAGLAHELNNPAAAALRGAETFGETVGRLLECQFRLSAMQLSNEQVDTLRKLAELCSDRALNPSSIDSLTRSDREVEIEDWLLDQGVENGWQLAQALVELDIPLETMRGLTGQFSETQFPVVLEWLSQISLLYRLSLEIGEGTRRISEIVRALKSYSYMDQAPLQHVDIHQGLNNTLLILHSKLKRGIEVRREFASDLPLVHGFGGELNQVWTNLIDNAADALGESGIITLSTRIEGDSVIVSVADNGPGIPQSILGKIFDPFFTTKEPGKGTGLGLNITHNIIVQRHGGRIDVDSGPQGTRFNISLPINGPASSLA